MDLKLVQPGTTYTIRAIKTDDPAMESFLLRLGCYEGEKITLISKKRKGCTVAIKDGRYSIDQYLAEAIEVE